MTRWWVLTLGVTAWMALVACPVAQAQQGGGEGDPSIGGQDQEGAIIDDQDTDIPEPQEPLKLPQCPVMDQKANLANFVETDEGPVFFCCSKCKAKFEKSPDKFAEGVSSQKEVLAALPKVQVRCPVSGKDINKEISLEQDGQTIYFANDKSKASYEEDPDKYARDLANSFTHQTLCPIEAEPIDAGASMKTEEGLEVYFCCKKCLAKYRKDPTQYAAALKAQGFNLKSAGDGSDGDKKKEEKKRTPVGIAND